MHPIIASLLSCALLHIAVVERADERAAFVTTLGRDTVAVESVIRTASHMTGDIIVRVPSTVRIHYEVELRQDGSVARSALDMDPLGAKGMTPRRVVLEFDRDSVRVSVDSAGQRRQLIRAIKKGTVPVLMTGFGASFGLYSSMGLHELFLERERPRVNDTTTVPAIDLASAAMTQRRFVGRTAAEVDVDYFNILWTHLTVDASGRISSADARGTTEQTVTRRTEFLDIASTVNAFAAADRAGKGIGVASPNQIARGTIGGQLVVAAYGSPRRRGRVILGNVVPYDRVWRTGANEATTLVLDRDHTIGGTTVPAGAYSIWTIPHRDGTVHLIINRQHGQWGTDYDPVQDLIRVPMQVSTASTPQENFAINVVGSGNTGELRISWDTFVWSVPLTVK